jgi:hypothetical protein
VTGSKSVAAVLAACVATVALASACGADLNANTQHVVPPLAGIDVDSTDHQVGLRDLQIAFPGSQGYRAGATAPLLVRLFNNYPDPVKLTCVKVDGAPGTVGLVGGSATSTTPASTPGPTPVSTPSPPVSTPTGGPSGNGKKASPPASPPASVSPVPASAAPPSPTPTGPVRAPACGSTFSVTVAGFGYALLTPEAGRYLAVSGLDKPLTVGKPWLNLSFSIDTANGSVTLAAQQVPVGLPLSPLPRISGNTAETG